MQHVLIYKYIVNDYHNQANLTIPHVVICVHVYNKDM